MDDMEMYRKWQKRELDQDQMNAFEAKLRDWDTKRLERNVSRRL